MERELPKHEKIRFRRDEITDLGAFPSAADPDPAPRRRWLPVRARRILLATFAGAAGLVLLLVIAVYAIGVSGIGSEQLRVAAERNLEKFAGFDITASVGPARITFDASRFLALEVRDVSLKHASDGSAIADAGVVRFGVRLLPLLSGDVRLSSARLSEAQIVAPPVPAEGFDWSAVLRAENGLISPGRVIEMVFTGAHRVFDSVSSNTMRRITLTNVDLVLPGREANGNLRVVSALVSEKTPAIWNSPGRSSSRDAP